LATALPARSMSRTATRKSIDVAAGFDGELGSGAQTLAEVVGDHAKEPFGDAGSQVGDDPQPSLLRHLRSFGITNLFAVCVALKRAVLTSLSPSERM